MVRQSIHRIHAVHGRRRQKPVVSEALTPPPPPPPSPSPATTTIKSEPPTPLPAALFTTQKKRGQRQPTHPLPSPSSAHESTTNPAIEVPVRRSLLLPLLLLPLQDWIEIGSDSCCLTVFARGSWLAACFGLG